MELYVHIPFCVKKCNYCAFYSVACQSPDWTKYADAICKELDFWSEKLGKINNSCNYIDHFETKSARYIVKSLYDECLGQYFYENNGFGRKQHNQQGLLRSQGSQGP